MRLKLWKLFGILVDCIIIWTIYQFLLTPSLLNKHIFLPVDLIMSLVWGNGMIADMTQVQAGTEHAFGIWFLVFVL